MTDELKPCLAHPCDGAMKANLYDASLTCSKCQFQVADESEYSALVAGRQTAIDAALESVKEYLESAIQYRIISGDLYMVGRNDAFRDAAGFIESRIGTDPLAERDARIAELEQQVNTLNKMACVSVESQIDDKARIVELEFELIGAREDADVVLRPRITELERMLSEEPHNIPTKYVQHGGVTFALHGSSSIRAYEELEFELAEVRKDAEAWKEYAQHLEYCATCGESVHYCDIGTELRNAAMRQEAER